MQEYILKRADEPECLATLSFKGCTVKNNINIINKWLSEISDSNVSADIEILNEETGCYQLKFTCCCDYSAEYNGDKIYVYRKRTKAIIERVK